MEKYVYVFIGKESPIPSAVFSDFNIAMKWIEANSLSGILNKYPMNISLYDWAIKKEFFEPTKEYQKEANFIQRFTTASMEHWHIKEGKILNE